MLIITVWGLPELDEMYEGKLLTIKLENDILSAVVEIEELALKFKDIMVFFPPDKIKKEFDEEIIVFVDGLFEKPEYTEEVKNLLAEKIGKAVRSYFENYRDKTIAWGKVPRLIEVFVRSFNPRNGFWTSQSCEFVDVTFYEEEKGRDCRIVAGQ